MALSPTDSQLLLRSYARATNMLIAGRRFLLRSTDEEEALISLLEAFGAQVEVLPPGTAWAGYEAGASSSGEAILIDLTEDTATGGTLTVTRQGVYDPDGLPLIAPHEATDPSYGTQRIEWARAHMPITRRATTDMAPLVRGRSIGLSLVLEPKTAALALMLAQAGAHVSVFGWASETRDDVAQSLREAGLSVFADSAATPEQEEELARNFLAQGCEFLLDDGSHLIRMAHDPSRAPHALTHLKGAAEETTSGIRPLRTFPLRIPVLASNDARSKTLFDNAYGTGQTCWTTIMDLIDPHNQGAPIPGMNVGVIGYGDVGKGCARFGRALGGRITVIELDPVRALQAQMDGFSVSSLEDFTPLAGMLISATGEPSTIPFDALNALPENAIVTVAGGVDGEVEVAQSLAGRWSLTESEDRSVQFLTSPHGKTLRLLEHGEGINYTAGEGNPIEIMDMSFGVQLASLRLLLTSSLAPGLHDLPRDADDAVSRAALRALK